MSKSASIDDLREKNLQLEAEVVKLSEEVQEVLKRQEESQRRMEENSRAVEDKLGNLSLMMERTLRQISGKNSIPIMAESSNGNRPNGDNHSKTKGKGVNFGGEEDGVEPELNMTNDEINWTNNLVKERERAMRNENRKGINIQLPRMEFPRFDGGDPKMWRVNCEFYFEMFEVPEVYKTRMAVMNFSEEVHEWYRCLTTGTHQLPWELLADEVMARFQSPNVRNPVDEFKRTHQIGRVDEFIKRFDRVRARLLCEKPNLDEEFFVDGFISGLKEEIRHTVELFNPRGLNRAFQCALKVETALDSQMKKPKEHNKGFKSQNYPLVKQKFEKERMAIKDGTVQKPWPQKPNQPNYTYEQRRELGLCHKCHGKYFPGHQCTGKVLRMSANSDSDDEGIEDDQDIDEQVEESEEGIEQAMISMFSSNDKKKMNSMRFKGHIGKLPVCALVDSGSTHSFVNPELIKKLELQTKQTNPMVVRVANGEAMVTDTICKELRFDLQGFEFTKEVRLLAIQGYDMILGLDWLTSLGPMKIDWGKGTLEFKLKDQNVKLRVGKESAELRLMEVECDIEKELKKGNEVVIA